MKQRETLLTKRLQAAADREQRTVQVVVVFALHNVAADVEFKRMCKSLVALASCHVSLFLVVNLAPEFGGRINFRPPPGGMSSYSH